MPACLPEFCAAGCRFLMSFAWLLPPLPTSFLSSYLVLNTCYRPHHNILRATSHHAMVQADALCVCVCVCACVCVRVCVCVTLTVAHWWWGAGVRSRMGCCVGCSSCCRGSGTRSSRGGRRRRPRRGRGRACAGASRASRASPRGGCRAKISGVESCQRCSVYCSRASRVVGHTTHPRGCVPSLQTGGGGGGGGGGVLRARQQRWC